MKIRLSYRYVPVLLASSMALSTSADASILLTITELANGKTKWQMTTSETPFVVGQFSPTGNYFENIILPQNAFDFDYSAPFSITFPAPIGQIRNVTTGATIDLTGIGYSNVGGLRFEGGLMSHALGNSFEIVDLPSISLDVPFSDILTTGSTAYSVNGAWHQVGQVEVTVVPIPETSAPLMAVFGSLILCGFRRRRAGAF